MTTVKINENNIVTVIAVGSLALLILVAAAGFMLRSSRFALSALAGGLLAISNFYWLRSVLIRSFRLQPEEAPRFAVVRYMIRLMVLAIVLFFLLVYCKADAFGLLLGLSVLVINIMALSFYMISAKGD